MGKKITDALTAPILGGFQQVGHSPIFVVSTPFGVLALSEGEILAGKARMDSWPKYHSPPPAAEAVNPCALTAEQAGEILNLDPSWLMTGAREESIPVIRFGRYVRFDPADIIAHCRIAPRGSDTRSINPPPTPKTPK